MRLRQSRLETYYHRKRVVKKDNEGSTYEEYGAASSFSGESFPAPRSFPQSPSALRPYGWPRCTVIRCKAWIPLLRSFSFLFRAMPSEGRFSL